jgi:UDP-2-acetamido-2-deoxy-ribo-hexuluronate aminotransferase
MQIKKQPPDFSGELQSIVPIAQGRQRTNKISPALSAMESMLARFTGARHCISVASSQEAIALALIAIGLRPGDEVITSPFSGSHSASVVTSLGGTPIFVDINRSSCNVNTELIEDLITSRTRAVIPVSLFGQPSDMEQINAIARRNGIVVIEDAVESFGASYKGKRSCNLSTIGCTGFGNMDPMSSSAGGGAVFTNDDRLAAEMRALRQRSQPHTQISNGREGVSRSLTGPDCALVTNRFLTFDQELDHRRSLQARYESLFCGRIDLIGQARDRTSAHAQYVVLLDDRDRLRTTLEKNAKSVSAYYSVPVSGTMQPAIAGLDIEKICPVAAEMEKRFIGLPMTSAIHPEFAHHLAATLLRAAGLWAERPRR